MNPRLLAVAAAIIAGTAFTYSYEKRLLDDGWTFQLTDDKGVSHPCRNVDLPHDWSSDFDFDSSAPAGNDGGYLPTGKGSYAKRLFLSEEEASKVNRLYLEGVYMNATVCINGDTVGRRPYGYSSMIFDISKWLKPGENEIRITSDNSKQKNCRWYSGSGIYRHVWLLSSGEVGITPWSTQIITRVLSDGGATVEIKADIQGNAAPDLECRIRILSEGEKVAESSGIMTDGKISCTLQIDNPRLWSPETPNLYTAELTLLEGTATADRTCETFGIREFSFSAEKGAMLNGRPIEIFGGCVHHDNGLLGARSYDDAEARKVRLMKEAGFNAVRTSHNPPAPAFLDECDRQGLLVVDEAFDGWHESKTAFDYASIFDECWREDVGDMVRRDRNHPSVVCWSIGNEIIERKSSEAVVTADSLASLCRRLDPTRPVTSALAAWDDDWEIYDPLASKHDIVGYNYMIHKAEGDHSRIPERVMWQTESYPRDAFKNWKTVRSNPYVIGDFVWTAIDYLGESGIGRHYYEGEVAGEHWERNLWPWHGAYCGDIDLTGLRKPISHYRRMLFNPDEKIHLSVREPEGYNGNVRVTMWGTWPTSESWTWKGHEGKEIDVEVASLYPMVRLILNGETVGESSVGQDSEFKATFRIPYRPGELKAIGIGSDGEEKESMTLFTAGEPYAIRLTADKTSLRCNNQDLAYIVAEIVDANGTVVADSDLRMEFSMTGNGAELIATGSGDMKDVEGYHRHSRRAWRGRALAVVKATKDSGEVEIRVSAPGIQSARMAVKSSR